MTIWQLVVAMMGGHNRLGASSRISSMSIFDGRLAVIFPCSWGIRLQDWPLDKLQLVGHFKKELKKQRQLNSSTCSGKHLFDDWAASSVDPATGVLDFPSPMGTFKSRPQQWQWYLDESHYIQLNSINIFQKIDFRWMRIWHATKFPHTLSLFLVPKVK